MIDSDYKFKSKGDLKVSLVLDLHVTDRGRTKPRKRQHVQ